MTGAVDEFVYLPYVIKNAASTPLYSISGNISDEGGAPISGVTISDGADITTTTDSDGDYTLSGLPAGAYSLTPEKSGYTFSPASRNVSVPPDATAQDFVGSASSISTQRLVLFEAFLRET